MKTKALLVTILFLSSSLFSFDGSLNDLDRIQIQCAAKQYKTHLSTQYFCLVTKYFHIALSTSTRKEEIKKCERLDELINHLEENDWSALQTHNFIMTQIAPFSDIFGQNFTKICKTILLFSPSECTVCWSAPASAIMPCGHMPCCHDCLEQLPNPECPLCRVAYSDLVALEEVYALKACNGCQKIPPDMLIIDCKHLLDCEECFTGFCPLCKKNDAKARKIFLHDQNYKDE